MDLNQTPIQLSPPLVIQEKSKSSYFTRLFAGRLNRQNYILGSTFFVLIPLMCFLVVIFNILLSPSAFAIPSLDPNNLSQIITPHTSILSLLETPTNELWSAIGILFTFLSLPYLFSLQIRRLHDLNLNGWLWTITIIPFISLFALPLPGSTTANQIWLITANVASFAASLFSFYITLWPGTKGPNNYGEPPLRRSNFLGDILCLH